ncbi:hypothetical protein A1351_15560 [Methylosinus sp. R-45379]|nr:hypothetical protein A1351_15560 [Methylosinus sp. R-45379]
MRLAYWDALTVSALPSWLTLTRATTGTYFDASAVMQSAAINAARFDHNPLTGAALGVLCESSRTNLMANSDEPGSWTPSYQNATKGSVIVGPNGATSARRITFGAADYFYGRTSASYAPAAYTGSVHVRSAGKSSICVRIDATANGSNDFRAQVAIASAWVRPARTFALAATDTIDLGFDNRVGNGGDGIAGALDAFGGQIEAGAFASSYIPTSGVPVTRAADALSIAAGYSGNPIIVETQSVATGALSRTLYNPGSGISALADVWLRKAAVYRIGAPAGVLNAIVAGGAW